MISEVFAPAMTAMAAPVRAGNGAVIGVITIAGPLVRLTEERMPELGPDLLASAQDLARAGSASTHFKNRS